MKLKKFVSLQSRAHEEIIKKAKMYGPPYSHFKEVANNWSAIFGVSIKPSDVCRAMMALKQVREKFRHDPDNILDNGGYGLLYEMMLEVEREKE